MRHYCTLFNSAYLPKGLAMYHSLAEHSSEPFTLHVLPMDEETRWTLDALELPGIRLVDFERFVEYMGLENARETRSVAEFCWTCGSNLMLFLLERGPFKELTYLDADLFFFSDPSIVFDEIGMRQIAITPHRLIPSKRHLEENGKFNVGWVTVYYFAAGQTCLQKWARDCRDKCSATDGCGDQKYLDEWPEKYGGAVCELGISVNVAPWNLANWDVTEGPCVDGIPIICYHLHEFTELLPTIPQTYRFTNYKLRDKDIFLIYAPYVEAYEHAKALRRYAVMKMESQRA